MESLKASSKSKHVRINTTSWIIIKKSEFFKVDMNNSSDEVFNDKSSCPYVVSGLLTATVSLISIWAFIGNTLVTVAFLKDVTLRTSTNYFIVNMAISDLLSAMTNWPLYAIEGMQSGKHTISDSIATPVCKFCIYSRSISQAVSVISLVLIVVDRFIAIVRPFQATRITGRSRVILLLSTWIVSVSGAFPYVWFSKIVLENRHKFCRFNWGEDQRRIFYAMGFVVFYCVPLQVIPILYCKIMKCLRQTRPTGDEVQQNVAIRNRQQNQVIMKVFISIVITFFLCWTPLCVFLILKMVLPSLYTKDSCLLSLALFYYIFPSISAAVNPVILIASSSRFHMALRNMFCFITCSFTCGREVRVSPENEMNVPPAAK